MGGVSFDAVIHDPDLAAALEVNKKFLKLQLMLPEHNRAIETRAGVAWMYSLKAHSVRFTYGLGAAFVGTTKAETQALSSYISKALGAQQRGFSETRQRVFKILSKIARVAPDSFGEATLIRDGLGFDSLMAVEALAAFETIFGIEIDETRAFELRSVGDVLALVEDYLAEHQRPAFAVQLL
ncbi:MAG: acyl carrier protein [Deltaproteobacteria bacterium]|nr:acyl carrier protein [Deltaproteobacteria bacterium]